MNFTPFPPLTGLKLVLSIIIISIGNIMVVLDSTIVNVSVATISGDLGVAITEGTWLVTSYAVAEAVTVPLTGWLCIRFGQVKLFVVCIFAFVFCSFLCGLSQSIELLVVSRILQGLAGGPIIPLSSILLMSVFPRDKAHVALALWGMTTVIAPILGPILGGVISEQLSWPWIFYINIPLGLVGGVVIYSLMKHRETPTEKRPIDGIGLILLIVFVTTFQLMLDKGRELDWFESSFVIFCALLSLATFVLFIIWELTEEHPIIDLSVLKSRSWVISTLALSLIFGLFFGNMLITPLWLQEYMGYTSTWAGLALAPIGIFSFFLAPIIGKLMEKVDPRLIVTFGMLCLGVSFAMRSQFNSFVDYGSIVATMLLLGAGLSACMIPLSTLCVADLPASKIAAGTGLQNFLRVMSMAIGASLSHSIWEHMSREKRNEMVNIIDPNVIDNLYGSVIASGTMTQESSLLAFAHTVEREAAMLALNDFYVYATALTLLFAIVVWFAKRPEVGTAPVQGH